MDGYIRQTKSIEVMAASWRKDEFVLTTDPKRISRSQLNDLFASDKSVGKRYPADKLEAMVQHSLIFAVVKTGGLSNKLVGFARFLTNHVTEAYFEELVLLPECYDRGLIHWMGKCMNEFFESMPYLEGVMAVVEKGGEDEFLFRRHLDAQQVPGESRVELIKFPPGT